MVPAVPPMVHEVGTPFDGGIVLTLGLLFWS